MEQKHAVIFSPIMAKYDPELFKELTDLLNILNYKVTIHNSLDIIHKAATFQELVERWNDHLSKSEKIPDLAIGQAFGGSLLISLLDKIYKSIRKVVLVPAPVKVNKRLREILEELVATYKSKGIQEGTAVLEKLVLPLNKCVREHRAKAVANLGEIELSKAILGYRMLKNLDLSDIMRNCNVQMLSIYGVSSQLVNRDNIILSDTYNKQIAVGISGCGMRPLKENPELSLKLIRDFINDN